MPALTRVETAAPRAYLADELASGAPVRLDARADRLEHGDCTFRVVLAGPDETLVVPVYVNAESLFDYERFVVTVARVTGRAFSCEPYEAAPDGHRARSAWRRHIGEALARRECALHARERA